MVEYRYKTIVADIEFWKGMIPCQAACPIRTDAGKYVQLIAEGQYQQAYLVARSPNPLASVYMSGNVVEWTQSIFEPYSRERPYVDEKRNRDQAPGQRVARGGSWYSASVALLCIPYRDAFLPEVSNQDLGFRIVARPLPQQLAR